MFSGDRAEVQGMSSNKKIKPYSLYMGKYFKEKDLQQNCTEFCKDISKVNLWRKSEVSAKI